MNSRITKTMALAALLTGTAGVASATEGWYGRVDLGRSLGGEAEADGGPSVQLETDWSQHAGLGYAFDNGFRLEGEIGHRFNQLELGGPADVVDGDIHAWSAMANLFYDFLRGGDVEPYIGVGVGAARLNGNYTDSLGFGIDDQDTTLAYQGLVGVAVSMGENFDVDIGYRYFVAPGGTFGTHGGPPAELDVDYEHQAVTVGLRYQFAAAAPPPPPPPPPAPPPPPPPPAPPPAAACPTSDFVVYFEWDRSNLNADALATIDSAVARARQCNISGVVVVGNTDTSGSPTYNNALSERRASVVRDALVSRGIAAGAVRTEARGEANLARATRDGVREPLNRRSNVTITFR